MISRPPQMTLDTKSNSIVYSVHVKIYVYLLYVTLQFHMLSRERT